MTNKERLFDKLDSARKILDTLFMRGVISQDEYKTLSWVGRWAQLGINAEFPQDLPEPPKSPMWYRERPARPDCCPLCGSIHYSLSEPRKNFDAEYIDAKCHSCSAEWVQVVRDGQVVERKNIKSPC